MDAARHQPCATAAASTPRFSSWLMPCLSGKWASSNIHAERQRRLVAQRIGQCRHYSLIILGDTTQRHAIHAQAIYRHRGLWKLASCFN